MSIRTFASLAGLGPLLLFVASASAQFAISEAFTYQGRLQQDGQPLNGTVDLRFTLWDGQSDGAGLGSGSVVPNVPVVNGVFSATVNTRGPFGSPFGFGAFDGTPRFLEVAVRAPADPSGQAPFVTLAPRQPIMPTPYALALPALQIRPTFFADQTPHVVGGFSGNVTTLFSYGAAIGGGGSAGLPNKATDHYCTVGGGIGNLAGDDGGAAGDAAWATVGGGVLNEARAPSATVAGGDSNIAAGSHAFVGGGYFNLANGRAAMVVGGEDNLSEGDFSFSAGRRAQALHAGAFVWADATKADVSSTTENQVTFRASGGMRVLSDAAGGAGVELSPGGGAWDTLSDRAAKENLAPVDAAEILKRVAALPIFSWNYRTQPDSVRHIGIMAQDFHAAFGLGSDARRISTIDADGVALAAIQALHQQLAERDAELAALRARLERIEAALESR